MRIIPGSLYVAYEEAAHAAAAHALGYRIGWVSVWETPPGVWQGATKLHLTPAWFWHLWPARLQTRLARRQAVIATAAVPAQFKLTGNANLIGLGSHSDVIHVKHWAKVAGCRDADSTAEFASEAIASAIHLVDRYWQAIIVLAAQLERQGSIGGREVHRVISAALKELSPS